MSKQSSRTQLSHHLPPLPQPSESSLGNALQGLLCVGRLHANLRKLEAYQPIVKQSAITTRKKSHKSLGTPLQQIKLSETRIKLHKNIILTESVNQEFRQEQQKRISKSEFFKDKKQNQEDQGMPDQEIQSTAQEQQKQLKFQFAEKKMKIGKKNKSDVMKQFILETLLKGRAEGNCITINKGTAQCNYSPPKHPEKVGKQIEPQRYPLVLVQQPSRKVLPKRKMPILPKGKCQGTRRNNNGTVRLPSIKQNHKWVELARKLQKKDGRVEKKNKQAQEYIAQQIVEEAQQKQIIPEEIVQ